MKIPGADEAVGHVMAWATRESWRQAWEVVLVAHVGPICDQLGVTRDELEDALSPYEFDMAMGCAFEDLLTRRFETRGRNIVDDYLDRRGIRESLQAREYLRALRDSAMSLYEVVEVRRGTGLLLRDLLRGGEAVEVDERAGSESMVRWDRIAARILTIRGARCLSGAVLHFPHEAAEAVLHAFRKTSEPAACVFTVQWLSHSLDKRMAPPPEFVNFEGHPVAPTTVRFPFAKGAKAEIIRLLDGAAELERASDEHEWTWRAAAAEPTAHAKSGISVSQWTQDGAPVLGSVELRGRWLVLEVNSAERAELGREMLRERLGAFIGEAATTTESLEQALRSHRSSSASADDERNSELPPEVEARLLRDVLDRHYRQVLDEPLPMLGGRSPRAAARSAKTRASVIDWLKVLENSELRGVRGEGLEPYDFAWIWRELGLLSHRR